MVVHRARNGDGHRPVRSPWRCRTVRNSARSAPSTSSGSRRWVRSTREIWVPPSCTTATCQLSWATAATTTNGPRRCGCSVVVGRPRPPVGRAGRSLTRSRAPSRLTVSVTNPLVMFSWPGSEARSTPGRSGGRPGGRRRRPRAVAVPWSPSRHLFYSVTDDNVAWWLPLPRSPAPDPWVTRRRSNLALAALGAAGFVYVTAETPARRSPSPAVERTARERRRGGPVGHRLRGDRRAQRGTPHRLEQPPPPPWAGGRGRGHPGRVPDGHRPGPRLRLGHGVACPVRAGPRRVLVDRGSPGRLGWTCRSGRGARPPWCSPATPWPWSSARRWLPPWAGRSVGAPRPPWSGWWPPWSAWPWYSFCPGRRAGRQALGPPSGCPPCQAP